MAKVPIYQPTTGANTPASGPMNNPAVAAAPARAAGEVAESVGRVGGQLLKLQEQRNIRVNNIKALNLHNQYSEEVNQLTVKAGELEGSDAFGAHDNLKKALTDLAGKYDKDIDNELLREQFNALRSQIDESALSQVAAHESRQFKVAQKTAFDNLVDQQGKIITANPDAGQVEKALATVYAEADLHFSGEKGEHAKREAETKIKSSFVMSLGESKPKEAEAYLEDWKASGTLGAQEYLALKTHLKAKNSEITLSTADASLMKKHGGDWLKMYRDVSVNYEKYGLDVRRAEQLGNRYQGQIAFNYSMEQKAKAQAADNEMGIIFKAIKSGDPGMVSQAMGVIENSKHMSVDQRVNAWNAVNGIQAQGVLDDVITGKLKTKNEVLLATHNMGAAGKEVVKYFDNQQAGDNEAIKEALAMYRENQGKKGLKFKLSDDVFKAQIIAQINSKNIHGRDIVDWAKKTIGYVEDKGWGFSEVHSDWKAWEANPKRKNVLQSGSVKQGEKGAGTTPKAPKIIPSTIRVIKGKQYGFGEDGQVYEVEPGDLNEAGK